MADSKRLIYTSILESYITKKYGLLSLQHTEKEIRQICRFCQKAKSLSASGGFICPSPDQRRGSGGLGAEPPAGSGGSALRPPL